MLKFIRMPAGILALTIAVPVLAQPAMTTPSAVPPAKATAPAGSTATAPKSALVDINTATASELKALPGVSDSDAAKIVQGRPYSEKSQLVSKKILSEGVYDKVKDQVIAKHPKS
jgi:DNA uptake protein ComE-like DNA-binding protein